MREEHEPPSLEVHLSLPEDATFARVPRKDWQWIGVARRHLARKYVRRIERTSDPELTVSLRGLPDLARGRQPLLLGRCAVAMANLYDEDSAAEWLADDRIRTETALGSSDR